MKEMGFKIENFHFIGHSLGAQIMGQVGRTTKDRRVELTRITGLDPAGELFLMTIITIRIFCSILSILDLTKVIL
jgi:predicted alpha/beta hydrolase